MRKGRSLDKYIEYAEEAWRYATISGDDVEAVKHANLATGMHVLRLQRLAKSRSRPLAAAESFLKTAHGVNGKLSVKADAWPNEAYMIDTAVQGILYCRGSERVVYAQWDNLNGEPWYELRGIPEGTERPLRVSVEAGTGTQALGIGAINIVAPWLIADAEQIYHHETRDETETTLYGGRFGELNPITGTLRERFVPSEDNPRRVIVGREAILRWAEGEPHLDETSQKFADEVLSIPPDGWMKVHRNTP